MPYAFQIDLGTCNFGPPARYRSLATCYNKASLITSIQNCYLFCLLSCATVEVQRANPKPILEFSGHSTMLHTVHSLPDTLSRGQRLRVLSCPTLSKQTFTRVVHHLSGPAGIIIVFDRFHASVLGEEDSIMCSSS